MRLLNCRVLAILIVTMVIIPVASAESVINTQNAAPYYTTIDPIGNHTVGEVFFINGSTNLPVLGNLSIWVGNQDTPTDDEGWIFDIPLLPSINNTRRWSANATNIVKGIGKGRYLVWVSYTTHNVWMTDMEGGVGNSSHLAATSVYTFLPANYSSPSTVFQPTKPGSLPIPTIIQSLFSIQQTPRIATALPTTQSSPLPSALPIIVIVSIVILRPVCRKK